MNYEFPSPSGENEFLTVVAVSLVVIMMPVSVPFRGEWIPNDCIRWFNWRKAFRKFPSPSGENEFLTKLGNRIKAARDMFPSPSGENEFLTLPLTPPENAGRKSKFAAENILKEIYLCIFCRYVLQTQQNQGACENSIIIVWSSAFFNRENNIYF